MERQVPAGQFDYRDRRDTWQVMHQSFQQTLLDRGDEVRAAWGDATLKAPASEKDPLGT